MERHLHIPSYAMECTLQNVRAHIQCDNTPTPPVWTAVDSRRIKNIYDSAMYIPYIIYLLSVHGIDTSNVYDRSYKIPK